MVGLGTGDVVAAVSGHGGLGGVDALFGEDVGDEFGFGVEAAAGEGTVDGLEVVGEAQVLEHGSGVVDALGGGDMEGAARGAEGFEHLWDAGVRGGAVDAGFAVVAAVGGQGEVCAGVVIVGEDVGHDGGDGRTDDVGEVVCGVRGVAEFLEHEAVAGQDAGGAVEEGAIEVEEDGRDGGHAAWLAIGPGAGWL